MMTSGDSQPFQRSDVSQLDFVLALELSLTFLFKTLSLTEVRKYCTSICPPFQSANYLFKKNNP